MAAQAKTLLLSDRRRMVELFQSSDLGRVSLEEFTALKPRTGAFSAMGRLDEPGTARSAAEAAVTESFDLLRPALANTAGLTEVELVSVDTEQASASTRSFDDGSQLVMVTDAMISLLGHLSELLAVWGLSLGRNRYLSAFRRLRAFDRRDELAEKDAVLLGGSAALRYYIQHQRVWALAAKVGTTIDRRAVLRNVDAALGAAALQFIVAHEIGHVVLGHSRAAAGAAAGEHEREIEADAFGFDVVSRATGYPDVTTSAALIGLSAIAISTEPLFVRAPESHPPIAERLSNVMSRTLTSDHVVGQMWGLVEMVTRAIDTDRSLRTDCWESMLSRSEFDTRHHSRQYFNVIRNFDASIDFSPTRVWAEIEELRDRANAEGREFYRDFDFARIRTGLAHLEAIDPAAALKAWGVPTPENLEDRSRPMSHHALASALLKADALACADGKVPLPVRLIAVYLSNAVAPYLTLGAISDAGQ